MAIPTQTDQNVSTIPFPQSTSCMPNSSFNAGISTALATVKTNGTATTANLSSDTMLLTADGGIWDDTVQAWIPVDKIRYVWANQRVNY
jgi:predicted NAD/FAD-dependent oxidoreductase